MNGIHDQPPNSTHPPSHHQSTHVHPQTYESIHANLQTYNLPDKIEWDPEFAYRNQPYRQLHHQNGTVGNVHIQLVEAQGLKRKGWSVLGLGPVKLLGLSKAVGEVSSFAKFWLKVSTPKEDDPCEGKYLGEMRLSDSGDYFMEESVKKIPARSNHMRTSSSSPQRGKVVQSSIIPSNNNPIWNPKDPSTKSTFSLPLYKQLLTQDGMNVHVQIQMEEDRTAVEHLLPLGAGGTGEAAILGEGSLDLTPLLLGKEEMHKTMGLGIGGAMDVWVDLTLSTLNIQNVAVGSIAKAIKSRDIGQWESSQKPSSHDPLNDETQEESSISCGRVRLIVSYEPHGLEPKLYDICCLESFARVPVTQSPFPPIFPPLQPFRIIGIQFPFYLVQYRLHLTSNSSSFHQNLENVDNIKNTNNVTMGTMKLHRNTIFIIERHTLTDQALHLLLKPSDVALSHPIGKKICRTTQPYVEAGLEMASPLLMSGQIMWNVAKTGAGAGVAGVSTVVKVMVETAKDDLEKRGYDAKRQHSS